jgi:signal transduction histidine kinase
VRTQLLANSADGFCVGNNDAFLYASPGLLRMLQYEDAKEEMLSLPIAHFLHPDGLPGLYAAWDAAKAASAASEGGWTPAVYTHRMRRRDGSYVWVEAISVQTPTHFYGMMRIVDDRKALEASLKDFLTSTMSDFRQPLAGIVTASELLSLQPCVRRDEEATFLVAAITAAARMLSGIVANVLSLRSLEAGDCDVADAPFSIRDCVAGVLSVCRMSLAHGDSAAIRWVDEDRPLPARVRGDADRLSQILLNLISNAVKFADGSAVAVAVRCEAAEEEGASSRLTLCVTDGGRGMTAEERDRAFESYVRAPTHKGGGTGLGALTRGVACVVRRAGSAEPVAFVGLACRPLHLQALR